MSVLTAMHIFRFYDLVTSDRKMQSYQSNLVQSICQNDFLLNFKRKEKKRMDSTGVFREGRSNWKKKKKKKRVGINRSVDDSFVRPVNHDEYIGTKLEQDVVRRKEEWK